MGKVILNDRKRCGVREVEPPKFPVREQGPRGGLICLYKYHSKTCMNENPSRTPSDAHPTSQQKRHSVWSALKNGGAENFDGLPVLRTPSSNAQFPV